MLSPEDYLRTKPEMSKSYKTATDAEYPAGGRKSPPGSAAIRAVCSKLGYCQSAAWCLDRCVMRRKAQRSYRHM